MKIVSWNINSIRARIEYLQNLIKKHDPDVILLQEIKCTKEQFPYKALEHFNYNIYVHGQKSWNGVAILSKFTADEVQTSFENYNLMEQSRFLEIEIDLPVVGYCKIINLYAPNGSTVGSDKFKLKIEFYKNFIKYLSRARQQDEQIIIAGDFNIAPHDLDIYDPKKLANDTCCTLEEKKLMRELLSLGFYDLYRLQNPEKKEFTWWDYRGGALEQNKGLRIDFILASARLANKFMQCDIDYEIRAQKSSSDHAPVLASVITSK